MLPSEDGGEDTGTVYLINLFTPMRDPESDLDEEERDEDAQMLSMEFYYWPAAEVAFQLFPEGLGLFAVEPFTASLEVAIEMFDTNGDDENEFATAVPGMTMGINGSKGRGQALCKVVGVFYMTRDPESLCLALDAIHKGVQKEVSNIQARAGEKIKKLFDEASAAMETTVKEASKKEVVLLGTFLNGMPWRKRCQ